MGCKMKRGKIDLDMFCNLFLPYLLLKDPNEMGHSDSPFILFSHPLKEIFIDLLPELSILLNLMIGFGEGAATGAAKGAERKTLCLGKGQITGCHKEIGIVIHRFNGIAAT
jgi:hypothetical protein